MIFLQLFYEFFKAGLFAIGGGLATLPFLKQISLGRASVNQNYVEVGLSVSSSCAVAACYSTCNSYRRSGYTKFFLESLYQLRELHNLELFYSFHNLSNSHGIKPPILDNF